MSTGAAVVAGGAGFRERLTHALLAVVLIPDTETVPVAPAGVISLYKNDVRG